MGIERGRRSRRLPGYDYSQPGAYFITICTKNKVDFFGRIVEDGVKLTQIGMTVDRFWLQIPDHFPNMRLDVHGVMPDHIHGIIEIRLHKEVVGVQNFEPLRHRYQKIIPKSIGSAVRAFKAAVTSWCLANGVADFRWQRGFYDHVIRDEAELNSIRTYILSNAVRRSQP